MSHFASYSENVDRNLEEDSLYLVSSTDPCGFVSDYKILKFDKNGNLEWEKPFSSQFTVEGGIYASGALHHIITRGIARRKVVDDNTDRDFFVERLGLILSDTGTHCFAWALVPKHFHLLLKTGDNL